MALDTSARALQEFAAHLSPEEKRRGYPAQFKAQALAYLYPIADAHRDKKQAKLSCWSVMADFRLTQMGDALASKLSEACSVLGESSARVAANVWGRGIA